MIKVRFYDKVSDDLLKYVIIAKSNGKIVLFDELPNKWTYPEIQPLLLDKVKDYNINISAI